MSPNFTRPGFSIEVPFLLLSTLTWLSCLLIFKDSAPLAVNQVATISAFITFALALSYFILRLIGYFDQIRLFPRKSDLILVMLSLPMGGITSWFVNSSVMHSSDDLLLNSALASPFLAMIIFGAHHSISKIRLSSKGCRKIVLDLAPQERAVVIQDLASWGFLHKLELLSRRDLEIELLLLHPKEISLVITSPSSARSFEEDETILEAHLAGIPIVDYRRLCANLSGRVRLNHSNILEYVLAATPQTMLIRIYFALKTMIEPIIASLLAIILLPVLLLIALSIRVTGSGSVLFRQTRVGFKQKKFELIKFRTMNLDSEMDGPSWCKKNDSRITQIGKFLRKTRLDELPQLWNVICGDMSFIGPRPEQPALEYRLREKIPGFAIRTLVKPGITGWAQVCSGYAASIEESRTKLEHDLFYIQNMSPRLDLIVLLKTISTAILGDKKVNKTILVELPIEVTKAHSKLFPMATPT